MTPRSCKHGHVVDEQNSYKAVFKGKACIMCKACRTARNKYARRSPNITELLLRRIISAVDEGASLNELNGRRGTIKTGTRIIAPARLRLFCEANPKFGKLILPKIEANAKLRLSEAGFSKRIVVASAAVSRNMSALNEIESALTMWLDPNTERPDIVSAMWLALADGRLKRGEIKSRAREFVRAHRRQYTNTGRYAFGSLDAPMGDDNPTARIELISEENRLWG